MPPAQNVAVSLTFGAVLVTAGTLLVLWHWRSWQTALRNPHLEPLEQQHLRRQFFRRAQVAGLMVVLGVVIPAGDLWLTRERDPRAFAWYVVVLLLLSLWLFLLAAFDWLASQAWNRRLRSSLRQLERKRYELEAEAARLRQRKREGRDA